MAAAAAVAMANTTVPAGTAVAPSAFGTTPAAATTLDRLLSNSNNNTSSHMQPETDGVSLAQLRVADLQRKKEDIERQLLLISQQMQHNLHSASAQPAEFPPGSDGATTSLAQQQQQHDRTEYTTTLHNHNNKK